MTTMDLSNRGHRRRRSSGSFSNKMMVKLTMISNGGVGDNALPGAEAGSTTTNPASLYPVVHDLSEYDGPQQQASNGSGEIVKKKSAGAGDAGGGDDDAKDPAVSAGDSAALTSNSGTDDQQQEQEEPCPPTNCCCLDMEPDGKMNIGGVSLQDLTLRPFLHGAADVDEIDPVFEESIISSFLGIAVGGGESSPAAASTAAAAASSSPPPPTSAAPLASSTTITPTGEGAQQGGQQQQREDHDTAIAEPSYEVELEEHERTMPSPPPSPPRSLLSKDKKPTTIRHTVSDGGGDYLRSKRRTEQGSFDAETPKSDATPTNKIGSKKRHRRVISLGLLLGGGRSSTKADDDQQLQDDHPHHHHVQSLNDSLFRFDRASTLTSSAISEALSAASAPASSELAPSSNSVSNNNRHYGTISTKTHYSTLRPSRPRAASAATSTSSCRLFEDHYVLTRLVRFSLEWCDISPRHDCMFLP